MAGITAIGFIPFRRPKWEGQRLYQVHTGTRDYEKAGVRVLPFPTFCKEESMP